MQCCPRLRRGQSDTPGIGIPLYYGARHLVPDIWCQAPGARHPVPDISCQTSRARHLVPGISCQASRARPPVSGISCQASICTSLADFPRRCFGRFFKDPSDLPILHHESWKISSFVQAPSDLPISNHEDWKISSPM